MYTEQNIVFRRGALYCINGRACYNALVIKLLIRLCSRGFVLITAGLRHFI